ncbi:low molecular weight phosphatase family protein [candidate division KSB1 bacterium]|nr:low molecular weight phosphatase family protein [candidate division KSB1 bacterium]
METVLFLCTGNYYRSRFAEEYFNHLSIQENLNWRADSRGLRQNMNAVNNIGPISKDVIARLRELGIKPLMASRYPLSVCMRDFQSASLKIALCEREHRPMMADLFPMFEKSITYWDVEDVPMFEAEHGLKAIVDHVNSLIEKLIVTPQFLSMSVLFQ